MTGPGRELFENSAVPSRFCSLGTLGLWHFGDDMLGTLLHALHVVIEVPEIGLERLLEALFHLEGLRPNGHGLDRFGADPDSCHLKRKAASAGMAQPLSVVAAIFRSCRNLDPITLKSPVATSAGTDDQHYPAAIAKQRKQQFAAPKRDIKGHDQPLLPRNI